MNEPLESARVPPRRAILPAGLWRRTSLILLLVMFALALAQAWTLAHSTAGIDFYQYWVIARVLKEHETRNIYSDDYGREAGERFFQTASQPGIGERRREAAEARRVLDSYQTPFLYSMIAPFSTGDYEADLDTFQLVSILTMLAGIFFLCRRVRLSAEAALALGIALLAWFEPFQSDTRVANVNRLQLTMLLAFIWSQSDRPGRRKRSLGGVLLGMAIMLKPTLGFAVAALALCDALNGRFRQLLSWGLATLLGVAGAFVYSSLVFGSSQCWFHWKQAIQSLPDTVILPTSGNFSLAAIISWTTGLQPSLLLFIAMGLTIAAVLWFTRRRAGSSQGVDSPESSRDLLYPELVLVLSAGALAFLLSSRLAWVHYFLLAVPAIILGLRPSSWTAPGSPSLRTRLRPLVSCLAIAGLSSPPILIALGSQSIAIMGHLAAWSGLVLFGMVLWDLAHVRLQASGSAAARRAHSRPILPQG